MSDSRTLEKNMTDYQKVLRKKIGEFMLVINDLLERDVEAHPTLKYVRKLENIKELISAGNKETTSEWAEDPEIATLMILLYNNGYPFQLYNRIAQTVQGGQTSSGTQTYPEDDKFNNGNALYKSYIIFGDLKGDSTTNPNHYTVELQYNLFDKIDKPVGMEQLTDNDNSVKIKVPGDGHCFYKSFAIWCMAYGVTIDHLENLSYNVPFEFDKAAHEQNFKVDLKGYTDELNVKIPKPISLPNLDNFEEIAKKMIEKVKNLEPKFGDFQDITGSEEYKNYNGFIKDDRTHCNKYKGNIKQEEEEAEDKE